MKRNLIAYTMVIIMIGFVVVVRINTNDETKEPTLSLSAFQLDSIAFEERFKIMLAESEKKIQEQLKLQESYQKGYEAGLNAIQRENAYNRGYEVARSIFKEDADYYRKELEKLIESSGKESSVNNYYSTNEEPVVETEKKWGIEKVSDIYSRSISSSENDTIIHYSDYIANLETRKLFFGFTSDLSVGLQDGDPVKIESWNYLGLNYVCGEDQNIGLHFGYSRTGYRLMCTAEWLHTLNYSFYATEKVTWGGHENGMSLSLGAERKWKKSPLSVYSEIGGIISNDLSPYFEIGARINFSKKILEF